MALDLMKVFINKPPELDFIWPGFLAGTVGALVAPGGMGKSFFALEAAMSVACHVPGGDLLELCPFRNGKVIYFAGEDPVYALENRIYSIGQHLHQNARESIAKHLILEPIMGKGFDIMNNQQFERLIHYARGTRLIILDTLSRIHQLDENSNGEMAQLITRLEKVAVTTGASILFLHHVSKGSVRYDQAYEQQAARGASALIDNARWCGYIAKMTAEEGNRLLKNNLSFQSKNTSFVKYGISKQNYSIETQDRWYKRCEGGVLFSVDFLKNNLEDNHDYRERRNNF